MNDYVSIDSKKYHTTARSWRPSPITPSTTRLLLSGNLDAAYGPATLLQWEGEVCGPVTSPGTGWGTISDLRTSLAKRQKLTFVDHYGTSYTGSVITGPFKERSLIPKWDSSDNVIYVLVKVISKSV